VAAWDSAHQARVRCIPPFPTTPPAHPTYSTHNRYLIGDPFITHRETPDDDAAEGTTNHLPTKRSADGAPGAGAPTGGEEEEGHEEPAQKKQRLPPSERKRLAKEKRKEQKGANKARKFARVQDEVALCHGSSRGEACADGDR
jgi:tRNA-dihydrouridine synthase 3